MASGAHATGPTLDWLGLPSPFPHPTCRTGVPRAPASTALGALLDHRGESVAREATDIRLWYDDQALHLSARCHTVAMDRVRALAARTTPYARDTWGDDALEVQIDVGRTRHRYLHVMLPPNGIPITFVGFNNRTEQGWHPEFTYRVSLEDNAWAIEAAFPFAMLGRVPADGDTWGLNVMRVNATEPGGYAQWAPTFGDAVRPELFGEIVFSGAAGDRPAEIAAYSQRAAARKAAFLTTINRLQDADVLQALGYSDWAAWGGYLAQRTAPIPLRWEDYIPGRDGVPQWDRPMIMEWANTLVAQIAQWSVDPPDPAAFGIEPLEALGDAYLLTGDRRYVSAFEHALTIHARRIERITATVTDPNQLHYATNPYHDSQIIRAEMLAYVYLSMRQAGLTAATHATMMRTILRGCRFAAFNIGAAYCYGNHQVYESGGLAATAALFPEFAECDAWAKTASRSIRLHLERELYPDGGYTERCGYHTVAMSYAMHAVATIRLNGAEGRFPELMSPGTLGRLEHMHDWLLRMLAPDGTMPAFGDCGAATMLRFLRRGAAVFSRPDLAWPLRQLAPDMVPAGLEPREPPHRSVALDSHFTILRDGWAPSDFYLAIDHGPLGGQHSHIDTLGFVAYAHGLPVAIDSGIGVTYEDPRYVQWFRALRAHNVIAIDDVESEKVAERTFWKPGARVEVVGARSDAYAHALGIRHDRTVYFVKKTGWLIHDQLSAPADSDLAARRIDWLLHTPYALVPEQPGLLHGAGADGGLLVLAGRPDELEAPIVEKKPSAVTLRQSIAMRLWDVGRRFSAGERTAPVTSLTWRRMPVHGNTCEFVTALLPYRGARPKADLARTQSGWNLTVDGRTEILSV